MDAKRKLIFPKDHGKGEELCSLLRRELALPQQLRSFTVSFSMDAPIIVTCEYWPTVPDDEASGGA